MGVEETENAGNGKDDRRHHEETFRRRFWVSSLLTLPILLLSPTLQSWLGFSVPDFPGSRWVGPVLALVVFLYGGSPFLKMAVPELRDRRPGMMSLISLAITVAFAYSAAAAIGVAEGSFFWEMATLIDVMLLGHWIEMRSIRRASSALTELAKLLPDEAEQVVADGTTETVPVSELEEDDIVLVRPGAAVPADGTIEDGESSVNQSMITGESRPVPKGKGDEVVAGTLNGDGSLRVRVKGTGDDTALAGIMRLVAEAQESKSDTQRLADRAAGWLFYIALAFAVVTAIGWIAVIGWDSRAVRQTVTVLVIACPHALGLAVPLVVAMSTTVGARNGILVRERLALERSRELDTVVFDKTGTLTKGELAVVDLAAVSGDVSDAVALAAGVEHDSEHPISKAILRRADELGVEPVQVEDFEAQDGRGISAAYDGEKIRLGGRALLEVVEAEVPQELDELVETADTKGYSVIYMTRNGEVEAAFALADEIRPESRQAVNALHDLGIDVVMLTGDSEAVARTVAGELGIGKYFAEVLPEHKDEKISSLQDEGRRVAMVGDGINDAPALTRADVGIAIGSGTDVAVESAGLVLIESNPLNVVRALELSRSTHDKMRQNLVWASGYNIVALPLAAGVLAPWGIILSPAVGALLMSASTVIVAINAQLLGRQELGGGGDQWAAAA